VARRAGLVKCSQVSAVVVCGLLLSAEVLAGRQAPPRPTGDLSNPTGNLYFYASVEVEVKGPDGAPVEGPVVVSLLRINGQVILTEMAKGGKARFNNVPKSELTAEVVAPGYQTTKKAFEMLDRTEVKVRVDLQPMSDKEEAASGRGIAALTPKVQKDVGKALEALRTNKPGDARSHLEAAQRSAPDSAEVEYLFGMYWSESNNPAQARACWMKTLELNPKHLSALIAVSQGLLQEHKAAEAMPYLNRALDAEPSSWRAHTLLAQAYLLQGMHEDAIKHAERAIELGHEQAASAQPLLARALAEGGDKERAIQILQGYLHSNPADAIAAKQLERLEKPAAAETSKDAAAGAGEMAEVTAGDTYLPVPSNWLPPDVDEKMPPVEHGAACSLDEVLQKAGNQLVEFVHDVDRYAATESLMHESINRYGLASYPEKRKFDYMVSIQEVRQGFLSVTEYRNGGGSQSEFPDGIVTNGLPALTLVFHPFYSPNYEMTCEGLTRWHGGLAWQVHFRQRPGMPNAIQSYQLGLNGPSYSVALKGRAWISADNFQIVRMETDMVAPMPQIRLIAEHTAIEYGPVKFHKDNVNMWLPQSAEVYFAWKGRQVHRRHSFSNYLLFAVEDRQRITVPKIVEPPPDAAAGDAAKPAM
jgi:tetratricopeptide (TPR) repeat protein